MKKLIFAIVIAFLSPLAQAQDIKDMTHVAEGKKIAYQLKVYKPKLKIKADETRFNQESAVNCSHLLYSLLSKGDVDGAAGLSNDPETFKAKFQGFKDRIGEDEFKQAFSKYFSGTAAVKYELIIGDYRLLILEVLDAEISKKKFLAAQPYVMDGGKFLSDDRPSEQKNQLDVLFNAITNKKLKLQ